MLLTNKYQRVNSSASSQFLNEALRVPKLHHLGDHSNLAAGWSTSLIERPLASPDPDLQPGPRAHPQQPDPLYLFACQLAWGQQEEPSAAWELLAAARSSHADTRAHARALLARSRHLSGSVNVLDRAASPNRIGLLRWR